MKNEKYYICERHCYRFYDRVSDGLVKVPNLEIVKLTCRSVECKGEPIEFCVTELKFFIPIFQRFIELAETDQQERIRILRTFIGGKVNPNYLPKKEAL